MGVPLPGPDGFKKAGDFLRTNSILIKTKSVDTYRDFRYDRHLFFKRLLRPLKTLWLESWQDFKTDLRTAKWLRGLGWWGLFIWIGGLISILTVLGILTSFPSVYDGACMPDDSFSISSNGYEYWSSAGFFQITLGFGTLTFSQAKAIDIIWDVVFGRGGQALIAIISWHVFAEYVTCAMEEAPVTYKTFRTIFLKSEASIFSIYALVHDFARRLRLPSRTAMIFMISTMLFTLSFPTIASAMTGYSSNVLAFVPDQNDNLVQFASLTQVLYIIHDGHRVGLSDDYAITEDLYENTSGTIGICESDRYYNERYDENFTVPAACYLQNNITAYVLNYGFHGTKNVSSSFMNYTAETLGTPILNISGYDGWADRGYGFTDLPNTEPETWIFSDQYFNSTFIKQRGTCQSTPTYKWGFSFMQLFIMVVLLMIWTLGIYTMWLRAHFTMRMRGREHVAGDIKAVFELAEAMTSDFEREDKDFHKLSEQQLRRRVRNEFSGGRISYQTPLMFESYSFRKGTWGWIKREKWWVTALCVAGGVVGASSLAGIPFFLFMFGPVSGILFAMQLCNTNKSKGFMIFVWELIWAAIATAVGIYFKSTGIIEYD